MNEETKLVNVISPLEIMRTWAHIVDLLKAQEPREITKVWAGVNTPYWALKPEDIHEPAYLAGQIVIFNGKPTDEQREKVRRNE